MVKNEALLEDDIPLSDIHVGSAVKTRAQSKQDKNIKALKVFDVGSLDVSHKEFKELQERDETLIKVFQITKRQDREQQSESIQSIKWIIVQRVPIQDRRRMDTVSSTQRTTY